MDIRQQQEAFLNQVKTGIEGQLTEAKKDIMQNIDNVVQKSAESTYNAVNSNMEGIKQEVKQLDKLAKDINEKVLKLESKSVRVGSSMRSSNPLELKLKELNITDLGEVVKNRGRVLLEFKATDPTGQPVNDPAATIPKVATTETATDAAANKLTKIPPIHSFQGFSLPLFPANTLLPYVNMHSQTDSVISWVEATPTYDDNLREQTQKGGFIEIKYEKVVQRSVNLQAYAKATVEALSDYTQLQSVIQNTVLNRLAYAQEKELWGSSTAKSQGDFPGLLGLAGLKLDGASLKPYLPGVTGAQAAGYSLFDWIMLANAIIVSRDYTPSMLFLNPATYFSLMFADKDKNGNVKDWVAKQGLLSQFKVIQGSSIPVGAFLLGDPSLINVVTVNGLDLEIGSENDDFTRGIVTILARVRMGAWVTKAEQRGLIYFDPSTDLNSIKTALGTGAGG